MEVDSIMAEMTENVSDSHDSISVREMEGTGDIYGDLEMRSEPQNSPMTIMEDEY